MHFLTFIRMSYHIGCGNSFSYRTLLFREHNTQLVHPLSSPGTRLWTSMVLLSLVYMFVQPSICFSMGSISQYLSLVFTVFYEAQISSPHHNALQCPAIRLSRACGDAMGRQWPIGESITRK